MAKINQDFIMYKDSNQLLEFTVEDIEELADSKIIWEMARTVDRQSVIVKNNSDITKDGNIFTVSITPEDNESLLVADYYHEARITDSAGNTRPVATGKVTVRETLTKSS